MVDKKKVISFVLTLIVFVALAYFAGVDVISKGFLLGIVAGTFSTFWFSYE